MSVHSTSEIQRQQAQSIGTSLGRDPRVSLDFIYLHFKWNIPITPQVDIPTFQTDSVPTVLYHTYYGSINYLRRVVLHGGSQIQLS